MATVVYDPAILATVSARKLVNCYTCGKAAVCVRGMHESMCIPCWKRQHTTTQHMPLCVYCGSSNCSICKDDDSKMVCADCRKTVPQCLRSKTTGSTIWCSCCQVCGHLCKEDSLHHCEDCDRCFCYCCGALDYCQSDEGTCSECFDYACEECNADLD